MTAPIPPSSDKLPRSANTYNGRRSSDTKQGAQKGHGGFHLLRADVEEKICRGIYEHRMEETAVPSRVTSPGTGWIWISGQIPRSCASMWMMTAGYKRLTGYRAKSLTEKGLELLLHSYTVRAWWQMTGSVPLSIPSQGIACVSPQGMSGAIIWGCSWVD